MTRLTPLIALLFGMPALLPLAASANGYYYPPVAYPPAPHWQQPPRYAYYYVPPRYTQPVPAVTAQQRVPQQAQPSAPKPLATLQNKLDPFKSGTDEVSDYTQIPDELLDDSLSSAERKQRFIEIVLPIAQQENRTLEQERQRMLKLFTRIEAGNSLDKADSRWLRSTARRYRVDGNPLTSQQARTALREKLDTLPASLTIAQAANESAWGRSRFAREALNLFGIWTYDQDKGIEPLQREAGKTHLIRRFDSLGESVRYYLFTLNSHPAYATLRARRAQARAEQRTPSGHELAEGLSPYSALGERYVEAIQALIANNDLERIAAIHHPIDREQLALR